MPTFGDFETIGEPIAITEQTGHVSTVWRARKSGCDADPTHAIKCFAPHRRKVGEGEPEDALDKDRGLEFLEGIKQLKKAHAEGGRCLSPIHAFGFADEGAWYVTDFYPRNTLKAWIARRGSVDGAALGQVVQCIVTACLALKRSRGYSHGNLKAANVFLVGKPRPLRKTPLELADAYPAAPLQLARLTGNEKHTVDDLLHQVMEVQDLRALGELLLQLVEGRLVASAYDYNYPIAASPAWERLGRDAERWRELTNQLLDPRLSLEKISLESLERDFRPGSLTPHLPKILAGAGAVCVLAVGIYLGLQILERGRERRQKLNEATFVALMNDSKSALDRNDFAMALQKVEEARRLKPDSAEAANLKNQAAQKMEAAYQNQFTQAQTAFADGRFDEAERLAGLALQIKKDDNAASGLMKEAQKRRNAMLTQAQRDRSYTNSISAAESALKQSDFAGAITEADRAIGYRPNDAKATRLKSEAQKGQQSAMEQAQRDRSYTNAVTVAEVAYQRNDYSNAVYQADLALTFRSGDAKATRLKSEAQKGQQSAMEQAQRDRSYTNAVTASEVAYQRNDYSNAVYQADLALTFRSGDAKATQLKSEAQKGQQSAMEQAQRDRSYTNSISAAESALKQNDFTGAITEADRAIGYRPNDAKAARLKSEAQKGQQSAMEQAQRDRSYTNAVTAAEVAYQRNDYSNAVYQADLALTFRSGDAKAAQLKSEAQKGQQSAVVQAERDRKYEQAMSAGQAALQAGNYTNAVTQAEVALANRANDPSAQKLKTDAEMGRRNAMAQADRDSKYTNAINGAQAAMREGNYTNAITQAEAALANRANDPTATKLKNEAELQLKEVERQVAEKARGQNYQSALTAATKALAEAKAAMNYTLVNEKIKMALTQCAIARTNGDAGPIDRLTQELESLQVKAEAAKADNDYARAENLRQAGKIQDALAICQDYPSNAKFVGLKKSLTETQNAYTSAAASLAKGDYAFVKMLESKGYDKNPLFEPLVATGASESKQLAALESLKDPRKWKELSDDLAALKSQFPDTWKKDSFQALVKWVNENDPTRLLDVEILALKIKLGVDRKTVLNDAAGNRITRLPTTADVGSYYDFVDDIIKRLGGENSAAYKARKKDFDDIRSAINNWR